MVCNGSQKAPEEGRPYSKLYNILMPAFHSFKSYSTDHDFRYHHLLTPPFFQSFFLVDILTKSEKKNKKNKPCSKNFTRKKFLSEFSEGNQWEEIAKKQSYSMLNIEPASSVRADPAVRVGHMRLLQPPWD